MYPLFFALAALSVLQIQVVFFSTPASAFSRNIFLAHKNVVSGKLRIIHMATEVDKTTGTSFVRDVLRPYAMKLHTRDQAPKEGKQKAQTPFTKWQPSRMDYLKFLVDSLKVYEVIEEEIVAKNDHLASLRNTGLERAEALRKDIDWMVNTYDTTLTVPECGDAGLSYASFLRDISNKDIPGFLCHYYNQYFAHTAGGIQIGKRMSDMLLEGKSLQFYQWSPEGSLPALKESLTAKIDALAKGWSEEEQDACCNETVNCFRYGGGLMIYMRPPPPSDST
mmetsp:Transcript_17191/g.28819  ORF Transcript_17191/g.28819 Transcript_17191/m.28819 type:complete len:279 (-) Transcript_17191:231-1067(-)